MVFIGGWRRRRRGYGDYPGYPGYGYGGGWRSGGYGGGGGSCLRDMFLVESGCCLAELLGCGPQMLLLTPRTLSRGRRMQGLGRAETPLVEPAHHTLRAFVTAWLLRLIHVYQVEVSPRRPATCRFSPTCSHYAEQALRKHGLGRGLWLTITRLVRCRPGAAGGLDPVP